MRGYKIHCREPFHQRNFGVLKDCPDKDRKIVQTIGATELTVRTSIAMVVSAIWANNIITPSLFLQELFASIIVFKVAYQ